MTVKKLLCWKERCSQITCLLTPHPISLQNMSIHQVGSDTARRIEWYNSIHISLNQKWTMPSVHVLHYSIPQRSATWWVTSCGWRICLLWLLIWIFFFGMSYHKYANNYVHKPHFLVPWVSPNNGYSIMFWKNIPSLHANCIYLFDTLAYGN